MLSPHTEPPDSEENHTAEHGTAALRDLSSCPELGDTQLPLPHCSELFLTAPSSSSPSRTLPPGSQLFLPSPNSSSPLPLFPSSVPLSPQPHLFAGLSSQLRWSRTGGEQWDGREFSPGEPGRSFLTPEKCLQGLWGCRIQESRDTHQCSHPAASLGCAGAGRERAGTPAAGES